MKLTKRILTGVLVMFAICSSVSAEKSLMGRWMWYHGGYQHIIDLNNVSGAGLIGTYNVSVVKSKVSVGNATQVGQRFSIYFYEPVYTTGERWNGRQSWRAECIIKDANTNSCSAKGMPDYPSDYDFEAKRL